MVHNRLLLKISPELEFILSCINTPVVENKICSSLNWNMILNLALTHAVFPLVYNTLSQMNNPSIPEYVMKILQENCLRKAIKVVGIADEIVRIIKNMEYYDIQPIILKGPPLSVRINEDIALRVSNDIDILVDPLDFTRAEKLLEQIEYKRISPDFPLTPRQQNNYFKKDHHFEYFHDKRAIHVELHWRIRSFNIKRFPTASNLSTQKLDIAGYPVPVMEDEFWLMYLMVHGYKHKWVRLRWLYDIEKFIKQNIDWDKMILIADNSELRQVLHQTLILLNELFKVSIPDVLKQSVTNDRKAWQLSNIVIEELCKISNNPRSSFHKFSLKNMNYYDFNSKLENKLYYIFSEFKPRDIEYKLIALPDILYPLYYIIKPFYWLWRHIKDNSYIQKK